MAAIRHPFGVFTQDISEQIIQHIPPMSEHIYDHAPSVFFAVIPGWTLSRLPIPLEDPIPEFHSDGQNFAEKSGLDQSFFIDPSRLVDVGFSQ